jgi:hypothetical protein
MQQLSRYYRRPRNGGAGDTAGYHPVITRSRYSKVAPLTIWPHNPT